MKLSREEVAAVALEAGVHVRTLCDHLAGLAVQGAGQRRITAALERRGLVRVEPLRARSAKGAPLVAASEGYPPPGDPRTK